MEILVKLMLPFSVIVLNMMKFPLTFIMKSNLLKLTYVVLLVSLYAPLKCQKTCGFLMFSEAIERSLAHEMYSKRYGYLSERFSLFKI